MGILQRFRGFNPLNQDNLQLPSHGVGFQLEPSDTFLKCELVTKRAARYRGSSTTVVTINQESPLGSLVRW